MVTLEAELPATRRANTEQRLSADRPAAAAGVGGGERLTRGRVALLTFGCWVLYSVVAVWIVQAHGYMVNDALSRTLSAKLMVLSRDPHLAAVGFYWMPLPTVTRIPFVLLLDPFGHALLAGPLTSALFAAATVPVLVAIARVVGVGPRRGVVLAMCHALNPVTLYLAANGMSESTFAFFLALAVVLFLQWRASDDSRALLLFGLAVVGCLACRYETIILLPALLGAVALGVDVDRRRQAVVLVAVPSLVLSACWTVVSQVIVGDWFYWYNASRPTTATPAGAQWLPAELNPVAAVVHVGALLLAAAPVVVPASVIALLLHRARPTMLLLLGTTFGLPTVLAWQLADGSSWMVPRFLAHMPLLGAVIAIVSFGLAGEVDATDITFGTRRRRRVVRVLAWCSVAALPLGAITSTWYLTDSARAHAEGEYLFLGALLGRDDPRQTAGFDTSNEIFIADLDPYRALVDDLDTRLAAGDRVLMDSLQAVPAVLSRHTDRFVLPEDRDFEEILSDPDGRFDLIVLMPGRQATEFTGAIQGELDRVRPDGGVWQEVGRYGDGVAVLYALKSVS